MNAIPTKYAGVQFRSRLEAKWAAFMDLVGWSWEYEPFDLSGWIPDFFVWPHYDGRGRDGAGFLVEVKPAFTLDDFDVDRYRPHLKSSEVPRCEGIALLGAGIHDYYLRQKPYAPREAMTACQLGWFLNAFEDDGVMGHNYWMSTPMEYQYKRGEVNPLFLFGTAEYWEGEECWREAINRVQWRAPR